MVQCAQQTLVHTWGKHVAAFPALERFTNKRILILGLGREGVNTYTFLRAHLPELPLALTDRAPVDLLSAEIRALVQADAHATLLTGSGYLDQADQFDIIFKAPGIVPSLPELVAAREQGTQISSNTALFFELCPGQIVGVTGTKGKSTTTSLIYEVLRADGGDVRLLGNIGIPPLGQLDGATSDTTFVAELSSHQLSDLTRSPHIAVLQNIVPEHLDYYDSFEQYVAAKANIARYQTEHDIIVYNAGYPIPTEIAQTSRARKLPFSLGSLQEPGCTIDDGWLVYRSETSVERIISMNEVPLPGAFNLQNVMPAVAIGRLLDVPATVIATAIRQFRSLEHRLEYVGTAGGVRFYNDSLATVPEAAIAAIEAFADHPIVLIAGGYDRHLAYDVLARAIQRSHVRALVLFPPTGDRLWAALESLGGALPRCARVETMPEAVERAVGLAQPGDVVLLSPASASFGPFADYRDRGNQFKVAVGRVIEAAVVK